MIAVLLLLGVALAAAAAPPTPCTAPPGVVPVLPEGLCYDELVPTNPSGISIREYGGGNPNATFVSGVGAGGYINGVPSSIAAVLNYFAGANDEQRNILTARTVPFAIIPPGRGSNYWVAHIQVSPTQFPDSFLIPRPNPGATLSRVIDNIDLIAVFAFNTTGLPYVENFEEACGVIQNSTLPAGYAINTTSAWSPTYVFYNGQNSADFQSECWMAVMKV